MVVAEIACKITFKSIENVNGYTPFSSLGLDSLGIGAMTRELSWKCSLHLSETIIFQNPNIFDLALALADRLGLKNIDIHEQECSSRLIKEFVIHVERKKAVLARTVARDIPHVNGEEHLEIGIMGIGCRLPEAFLP